MCQAVLVLLHSTQPLLYSEHDNTQLPYSWLISRHELIKKCISTNFRGLEFHSHTHRHEFLFSTQLAREATEKQNVRTYQWRLSKQKAVFKATTHILLFG